MGIIIPCIMHMKTWVCTIHDKIWHVCYTDIVVCALSHTHTIIKMILLGSVITGKNFSFIVIYFPIKI